jgi:hypothetical protein
MLKFSEILLTGILVKNKGSRLLTDSLYLHHPVT